MSNMTEEVQTEFDILLSQFSTIRDSFGECGWDEEIHAEAIKGLKGLKEFNAETLGVMVIKKMKDHLEDLVLELVLFQQLYHP